ncbi:MAG: hypothetical protein J6L77_06195 [Coprococcus sp.]|nr:hypothetical protein [Coprococcus sp.]
MYHLSTQEKLSQQLDIIRKTINIIDQNIVYQPATYEFVKNFDRDAAIKIIEDYKHIDKYFTHMNTYNKNIKICLQKFDNFSLYFSLLWLKQYLMKREIESLKINCFFINHTVCQFKNHTTYNNAHFYRINNYACYQLYRCYELFVPETILIANDDDLLTVSMVIDILEKCIIDLETANDTGGNRQVLHFFQSFRLLLLNKKQLQPTDETLKKACNYLSNAMKCHEDDNLCNSVALLCKLLDCTYEEQR